MANGLDGAPRAFETAEKMIQSVEDYFIDCDVKYKFPNVSGFAVFCGICRDTFYAQKDYYPKAFKLVNDMLEDSAINNKNIEPVMKIFYMKNRSGYKDKQDVALSGSVDSGYAKLSEEELRKLAK